MRQNNKNNRGRGRGGRTAQHVAEKYMTLARDALSSGDSVAAENYFQHAEHYNRIIMTAQAQQTATREEERRQQAAASGQGDQPSIDSGQPTSPAGEEPQPSSGEALADGAPSNGSASASENGDARNQDEQPRPRRRRPPSKPRARANEEADVDAKVADVSESIADNPPAFLLNE